MYLKYFAFQYVDLEHVWWGLYQRHGVLTKLDIYAFTTYFVYLKVLLWLQDIGMKALGNFFV
jgi:hypothetical protein